MMIQVTGSIASLIKSMFMYFIGTAAMVTIMILAIDLAFWLVKQVKILVLKTRLMFKTKLHIVQ